MCNNAVLKYNGKILGQITIELPLIFSSSVININAKHYLKFITVTFTNEFVH